MKWNDVRCSYPATAGLFFYRVILYGWHQIGLDESKVTVRACTQALLVAAYFAAHEISRIISVAGKSMTGIRATNVLLQRAPEFLLRYHAGISTQSKTIKIIDNCELNVRSRTQPNNI